MAFGSGSCWNLYLPVLDNLPLIYLLRLGKMKCSCTAHLSLQHFKRLEKPTMVVLSFCENCRKYGTYVILLHLFYSIIGISNKGTHLDPSSWCQWSAICLGNTKFLREAEQFACRQLHRNLPFVLEVHLRKSQGVCAAKETGGLERKTGEKDLAGVESCVGLGSSKR